jgi:hypothetical protein
VDLVLTHPGCAHLLCEPIGALRMRKQAADTAIETGAAGIRTALLASRSTCSGRPLGLVSRTTADRHPKSAGSRAPWIGAWAIGSVMTRTSLMIDVGYVIRSALATAANHAIDLLDALTRLAAGDPWLPEDLSRRPDQLTMLSRGKLPVYRRSRRVGVRTCAIL